MNTQNLKFVLDLIKDDEAKKFWKQTYSGELTAQDLANELSDMHIMISNVPKIVNTVTGGLLSYATYPAETVIAKFNDYVDDVVQEAVKEALEEALEQPAQKSLAKIKVDFIKRQLNNLSKNIKLVEVLEDGTLNPL